jgi:molecular chaperone GrpE (heat shock protein)
MQEARKGFRRVEKKVKKTLEKDGVEIIYSYEVE